MPDHLARSRASPRDKPRAREVTQTLLNRSLAPLAGSWVGLFHSRTRHPCDSMTGLNPSVVRLAYHLGHSTRASLRKSLSSHTEGGLLRRRVPDKLHGRTKISFHNNRRFSALLERPQSWTPYLRIGAHSCGCRSTPTKRVISRAPSDEFGGGAQIALMGNRRTHSSPGKATREHQTMMQNPYSRQYDSSHLQLLRLPMAQPSAKGCIETLDSVAPLQRNLFAHIRFVPWDNFYSTAEHCAKDWKTKMPMIGTSVRNGI